MAVVADFPCRWDYIEPDTCGCSRWATAEPEEQSRAAAAAAWFLWAATGRRFGVCERTVLPCRQSCPCTGGACHSIRSAPWTPRLEGGKWYNSPCGCSACRCCAPCEVWLPGPVADVVSVLVDGLPVDPEAYRVDDAQFLVRDDGDCWPRCGALGAPYRPEPESPAESPGEPVAGLWAVTYNRGEAVPYPGQLATADLACELLRPCTHSGGDCDGSCTSLPPGLARLTREGVTMEINADTVAGMGAQTTGIASVDAWIKAMNPYGLAQRTQVISPDVGGGREVTWPN